MAKLAVIVFILVSVTHGCSVVAQQTKAEDSNVTTVVTEVPQYENSTLRVLSRKRRYVVFPKGSSMQCVYKQNLHMLTPLTKRFIFTMTLALAWKLPSEAHEIYIQKRDVDHTRAALAQAGYGVPHRVDMYQMIEGFLNLKGLLGRDCLKRAVCEASEAKKNQTFSEEHRGSFMEELHQLLFTLPSHPGHKTEYDKARDLAGKCREVYSECNSILDIEM